MNPTKDEKAPGQQTEQLEAEITHLREELGDVVAELDRRRREAMDLPLQVRRHAQGVALLAVGAGVLLFGAVGYAAYAHRRAQRMQVKVKRARRAAHRAVEHPERVAQGEPHMLAKIATAGLTALVSAAAKRAVERAMVPRKTTVVEREVIALPEPMH